MRRQNVLGVFRIGGRSVVEAFLLHRGTVHDDELVMYDGASRRKVMVGGTATVCALLLIAVVAGRYAVQHAQTTENVAGASQR